LRSLILGVQPLEQITIKPPIVEMAPFGDASNRLSNITGRPSLPFDLPIELRYADRSHRCVRAPNGRFLLRTASTGAMRESTSWNRNVDERPRIRMDVRHSYGRLNAPLGIFLCVCSIFWESK
jgi:hypothetical protein